MSTDKPTVSVIFAVYNGSNYVAKALDSILSQTFSDFEIIIVDDGSTDDTYSIISSYEDPRIKIFRQENRGLAASLNQAILLASGEFLARHDHDDISLPTRFEKQVAYLRSHPDCCLLGTRSTIWVGDEPTERGHDHPCDDATLKFQLLFDNFFVHGSVMIRRSALDDVGLYTTDPKRQPPEDYELWCRIARDHEVANLPEPLLIYREVPTSISRTVNFTDKLVMLSSENIAHTCGLPAPDRRTAAVAAMFHRAPLDPETAAAIPGALDIIAQLRTKYAAVADAARWLDDFAARLTSTGSDGQPRKRSRLHRFLRRIRLVGG
ncbi:MAG: glycosyltransferase [Hyphomicrobiales bacterium]|nr:glycosyltransferase [Hyphomicrobiales bacterium]